LLTVLMHEWGLCLCLLAFPPGKMSVKLRVVDGQ